MMRLLYTCLTICFAFAIYPVAMLFALLGKSYLLKRLCPPTGISAGNGKRIWIHAASVGETVIAFSTAVQIKHLWPEAKVFVSTMTSTGLARIRVMNDESDSTIVDGSFLAPLDSPPITLAFVRAVRPTALLLVETEIWPSLIRTVSKRKVPVTIINGRLSKRAFRRYMMFKFALKSVFSDISMICVQKRTFARRFQMLGVPPEHIEIMGNIKFDNLPDFSTFDREAVRRDFGIPGNAPLFVAGSTRPGEEGVLARAFTGVLARVPESIMMLVPRHLKRVHEVEQVLISEGLKYVKRSAGKTTDMMSARVLLLDTMGELISAFACSDVAFVGGSLRDFGGHNPLEPAALGIPVLFGPYMEQTGSKEILAGGAAALVHNAEELTGEVVSLFLDENRRNDMGEAGKKVIKQFRGTIERTLQALQERQLI